MVKITGDKAFAARLKRLSGPEMIREVGAALFVAGDAVTADAKISITAGSVSGKGHVPSKPGEPPNADTRTLDTNIETVQAAPLKVQVSSNAEYSRPLEFGTSKMAARPFMRPALQKNRTDAIKLVRDAVDRVTRRK